MNASFNPNGDFDWIIYSYSAATLTAGRAGDIASADFYNTIQASYIAPSGATTYSASGVFPGTLALPLAVPEPEGVLLFAIASAAFAFGRLRRQEHRRS